MIGNREPSSSHDSVSVDAPQQFGETSLLSRAQPLLKVVFVGSIVAMLIMWIVWSGRGYVFGVETPHGVSPTPSQSFWLIVASATSVASLLGMVSNTIFGLRKEEREARAEALDRRRQSWRLRSSSLNWSARKRAQVSGQGPAQTRIASPSSPVTTMGDRELRPARTAKEPPFPLDGERDQVHNKSVILDRRFQELPRLLGAFNQGLWVHAKLRRNAWSCRTTR